MTKSPVMKPAFWATSICCLLLALATNNASAQSPMHTANFCTGQPPTNSAPSAGGTAQAPLVVRVGSHVVVMEYEAWFSPRTGVAPQPSVTTCLQSADMQPLGGGYDSAAPSVIAQHVAWLEQMGTDAATLDLSNNVSCIFDADNPSIVAHTCPDAHFRDQQRAIAANAAGLYGAWAKLGTRLKLIPLLGAFDTYALTPDQDDPRQRSALQKEIEFFGSRMAAFPDLNVIYPAKPLMLIYLGTPVDPHRVQQINDMLVATGLDQHYGFRLIAGYLESQPTFWNKPTHTPDRPIEIAPKYGFWSVGDRLNFWGAPPAPYYPTYNKIGASIENMTASVATAGQSGWRCGTAPGGYCADAALRYCGAGFQNGCKPGLYQTLDEFMVFAAELQPTFLLLDQFNEFVEPDEGRTADSNDDLEPTLQWGYSGLRAVIEDVRLYRRALGYSSHPTGPIGQSAH